MLNLAREIKHTIQSKGRNPVLLLGRMLLTIVLRLVCLFWKQSTGESNQTKAPGHKCGAQADLFKRTAIMLLQ